MLSMHDVQLLWEIMSRCDDTNAGKIARILQDDLKRYTNKPKTVKRPKLLADGAEWLSLQEWAIRKTTEDMGEWLVKNKENLHLDEFRSGNKIPLIKRFRTLSQAYYSTTYDDKRQACGLKEAKDAIETVFGRYVKPYAG